MYDILILGAGVSGCACARELSRYDASLLVVDKEDDVGMGTSKANSAIVHAGYDCAPGTLMARLNVEGNALMGPLARDLDIPFRRNGSLVVCTEPGQRPRLEALLAQGVQNGVEGLRILEREELSALEPHLSPRVCAALYAPSAGILCPFTLVVALAENAFENGAEFRLGTAVETLRREDGHFVAETSRGPIRARAVVNAAGVYADRFHNLFASKKLHITPRRGDYCILDKAAGPLVERTIFPLPGRLGKGILVAPTIHGNTLLGPTAVDVSDPEATNTTAQGLETLLSQAAQTVPDLPLGEVITSFAGLRAHEDGHEFVIGPLPEASGFFDCAGIESPGLTSSPAVGKLVAELVSRHLGLKEKPGFRPTRQGILHPRSLSPAQYADLVRREPAYGHVICRCETVTEGEILDAIRRPLGARSLDGVKRRVWAGMGRCQGGFCTPRVAELLARELGLPLSQITKCGPGSPLVLGAEDEPGEEAER